MDGLEKAAINFGRFGRKGANFFPNSEAAALKSGDAISRMTKKDIAAETAQEAKDLGNGIFLDAGLWAVGKVSPKTKEKVVNKMVGVKQKVTDVDQRLAQKFIDKTKMKEGGMLHRLFTVNRPTAVAKTVPVEGMPNTVERTLYDNDVRLPSLLAPVQNTARVGTPVLASLYVGDKLYPQQEQLAAAETFENEKNGLMSELTATQLDKTAALQKVAHLEEKLEATEGMLKTAKEESGYYRKALEKESFEKGTLLSEKKALEASLHKQAAEQEELFLRTKARERAGHAVKIAEEMLECGMIKQAAFDEQVDFLMDCDDKTFNLYTVISKTSNSQENLLESSSYIMETRGIDEIPMHSKGISKSGQSIGEAARELLK